MKKRIFALFSAILVLAALSVSASAATPTVFEPQYGLVMVSSGTLNIRSGPGTSYSVVGSLASYDSVHIINESNSWYKIYIDMDGNTGWVSAQYVNIREGYCETVTRTLLKESAGSTATVNNSGTLATIARGTSMPYINEGPNHWHNVFYKVTFGYLSASSIGRS